MREARPVVLNVEQRHFLESVARAHGASTRAVERVAEFLVSSAPGKTSDEYIRQGVTRDSENEAGDTPARLAGAHAP